MGQVGAQHSAVESERRLLFTPGSFLDNPHVPAQSEPQIARNAIPLTLTDREELLPPITDVSIAQCFDLKNPSKLFIDLPILCLYDTLTFLPSSLEESSDGKKRSLKRNNAKIASIAERALYTTAINTSFITGNSFLPQLIRFADNDKEKPIP